MYFLGVLYGENGPKSENWAILTPRSSATVHGTKPDPRYSLALGLQRGVNSIYLQCMPWPVACSEWGACLSPSKFGVLGANDPWMETFINFCSKSAFHTDSRVRAKFGENRPLRSCRKVVWYCLQIKKNRRRGHVRAPFRPHLANRAQNFVNVVGPWAVYVPSLVRISCSLPDIFRKESKNVNTI